MSKKRNRHSAPEVVETKVELSAEFVKLAGRFGVVAPRLAERVMANFVREHRVKERAKKHLRITTDVADIPPGITFAIVATMAWLNAETQRLRSEETRETPALLKVM